MRSRTPAHPGSERRPFECRVRFHSQLRGAELVGADYRIPEPAPKPQPAPPVVPPPPAEPPPPPRMVAPEPVDFWTTEAGRQLEADRERIVTTLNRVAAVVGELREKQTDRLEQWQRAAVELAMTIATRLLHERIESGNFPIEAKVRDMIAQLGEETPGAIHLNPADLELLTSRLGGKPLTVGHNDPRFVADPSLGRGDCRVEGRESMLLSEVTQELHEIRDELLRSLGHARS